ncbi:MAG: UPF0175 family protein [Candidatus Riflebacteria bacterium]|nr:UPF0175 family protein [Candidatus Riflebacteria bacterium]
MELTDIKLSVPQGIAHYLSTNNEKTELERNAMILYPYIKNLTISNGKAAEILGIGKLELIELYNKLGLPYFDLDNEEINQDIDNIRRVRQSSL